MYWDAFFEISLGRVFSDNGRPQSLTVVDILAYLMHKDVNDKEERDEYLFLIRRLDNEYLKIIREQHQQQQRQRAAGPAKSRGKVKPPPAPRR